MLADGGLCCIDEFDGIRDEDVSALNEPMEQQTLTIAKAGMNTTLHTRTAIFAVTNPKGAYDPRQSIAVNTSLPGPLLSRFDIMLVLQDQKNPQHDATVAAHVLHHHQTHGQVVGQGDAAQVARIVREDCLCGDWLQARLCAVSFAQRVCTKDFVYTHTHTAMGCINTAQVLSVDPQHV